MDIFTDFDKMSFAQLREHYKNLRTKQKLIYNIPIVFCTAGFLLACLSGWSYYPSAMDSRSLTFNIQAFGVFDWILRAAMVLFLPYEKTERRFNYAGPIIMGCFMLVKILMSIVDPVDFLLAVYYYFAAVMLIPIHKEINFLKSLPDYPFPERVEIERKRERESLKYSENNIEIQRRMRLAEEKKKAGSMSELMDNLPKRHIEEHHITRGYFDETESDYTDTLAGRQKAAETKDDYERLTRPEFDETDPQYKGKFRGESGLTMSRRNDIEVIDDGYEADFFIEKDPFGGDEEIGDAVGLPDKRVSLAKNDPPVTDDEVS